MTPIGSTSDTTAHNDHATSRRGFISRILKTGLAVIATGWIGFRYYDPIGPLKANDDNALVAFPNYALPDRKEQMCIVSAINPLDRKKAIQAGIKALGGISTFIKPHDNVLIKVNAAFATPPMLGATTHPDTIGTVISLCRQAGAKSVVVTDNPINDPVSCFALSGIEQATLQNGGQIVFPKDHLFKPLTVKNGILIKDWPVLFEPFTTIDKVINIAPLKDHHRSGASMILKNWYGLLGGRRNIFHQDIHNIIKELSMMITPTLSILDGTVAMMKNGPTGGSLSDLKQTNTMILSTDPVAADAFGATLLEKSLTDLVYIQKAAEMGAGRADYKALNPKHIMI